MMHSEFAAQPQLRSRPGRDVHHATIKRNNQITSTKQPNYIMQSYYNHNSYCNHLDQVVKCIMQSYYNQRNNQITSCGSTVPHPHMCDEAATSVPHRNLICIMFLGATCRSACLTMYVYIYIYIYLCMYIYIYILCMYVCIHMYIYMYAACYDDLICVRLPLGERENNQIT